MSQMKDNEAQRKGKDRNSEGEVGMKVSCLFYLGVFLIYRHGISTLYQGFASEKGLGMVAQPQHGIVGIEEDT